MSNLTSNTDTTPSSDRGRNDAATTQRIFTDPVEFLSELGLQAEIVAETALRAAA